jgi:hypothetical protein
MICELYLTKTVCVCLSVEWRCMCQCSHEYWDVHMHVEARGWHWTLPSVVIHLLFGDRVSYWACSLPVWLDQLASEPRHPAIKPLVLCHTRILFQLRSSCLYIKHCANQANSLALLFFLFKNTSVNINKFKIICEYMHDSIHLQPWLIKKFHSLIQRD